MSDIRLDRRLFLRGLGTAMAVPVLEGMLPSAALAAPVAGKARPVRMAFFMVPNGVHLQDWTPAAEGTLNELPYILQPLKNVKDKVTVLTGLTHD